MRLKKLSLTMLALGVLMAAPFLLQAQEAPVLTVMSWNIRLDTPDDGIHQWTNRKDALCSEIITRNPDILGVQEAKYNQMKDMRKRLPGYKSVGVGRDDGHKAGEFSAVFYRKKHLKALQSGTFWLSQTPDVPGSRGWDAACNRVVSWVELKDKSTGRQFFVFNTHFDHVGEEARIQSAQLILKKMGELAGRNPVILTGDFNVTSKSKAYRILTFSENEVTLSDSRKRANAEITGPDFSFVSFDTEFVPTELIDFVLTTWDFEVISNDIFDFRSRGIYLSDHLPVTARIRLK
ncbi:MAG: endonuclease/exonuclease/phosphatase family protein [Bacteroidales bacterium]|jgi:endonuclease/exonuclease/phosphatase family metal-dependent hydrolase|nr:endonuclease/exonuclease/phosphatase family protein [Bacteroidales bacterium]